MLPRKDLKMCSNILSYFDNCLKKKPSHKIPLDELFSLIKKGKWEKEINRLRLLQGKNTEESLSQYDNYKKFYLGAVTFSGIFTHRAKNGIDIPSNCVVIDIDDVDDNQLIQIRQNLINDQHTLMAFTSPSGHGIKTIFKASFSDDRTFKIAWNQIAGYLKDKYSIKADSSGKDICRLCCVSYDPDAYFNENSIEFHINQEQLEVEQPRKIMSDFNSSTSHITTLPDEIRKQRYILKVIQSQTIKIIEAKPGERNNTLNIAAMIAGQFNWTGYLSKEAIQHYFVQAYLSHSDTTEAEAIATFNSGWNKGITESKEIPNRRTK